MPEKLLYTASTVSHLTSFHLPYLERLASDGWEVHTAARGAAPEYAGFGKHFDIPFEKRMTSAANFAQTLRLARLIRDGGYSLIVANTSLASYFTRMAVRLAGKGGARVVNVAHGYLFDEATPAMKRRLLLDAERMTAAITDTVVTMNRQDHDIARRWGLSAGTVVHTDGMGVRTEKFGAPSPESRARARRRFGIPQDAFTLVYAAEFSKRKNQRFLIDALPRLPEDTYLLLPGSGALLDDCRRAASDRIVFPGFVADIESCYAAADVCVSASRSEGLPFNVAECMACALPAVLTRVKGHEDMIEAGRSGFLFDFGDAAGFAQYVAALRGDAALKERMGAAAKAASERYSLERAMPEMLGAILGESTADAFAL